MESSGKSWRDRGLHSDLDGFEWAETNVGNELSRGRSSQEQDGLIFGGVLFTRELGVEVFEIFVEAVFASTLDGIANEGRAPTGEDTANPLCSSNLFPCFPIAFVEVWVDLATALDQVKWSDGGMSGTLLQCQYYE